VKSLLQKFKRISGFISPPVLKSYLFALALTMVVVVCEIIFPFTLQALIFSAGIAPGSMTLTNGFFGLNTTTIVIALTGVSLIKALAQGITLYLSCSITQSFRAHIRAKLTEWLLSGKRISQGSFLSFYGELTNKVGEMLLDLQGAITNTLLSLAFFLVLLKLSPILTLGAVIGLGLVVLPLRKSTDLIKHHGDQINNLWENLNKNLILIFKNVFFLRIYGLEKDISNSSNKNLKDFLGSYLKFVTFQAVNTFLPQVIGILVLVIICLSAKKFHLLETELIIPYLYLFFRFSQNFSSFMGLFSSISFRLKPARQLYGWWLNHDPLSQDTKTLISSPSNTNSSVDRSPFGWKVSNVTFQYSDTQHTVFQNFSAQINPGEITVITGKSGRGKSTLINLLVGEETQQAGSVFVTYSEGGRAKNSKVLDSKSWIQNRLGYVSSENYLFSGTIIDNLLFGLKSKPTPEEINSALSRSHCDFLVDGMKNLNNLLGDHGDGLSIGQRQRLCLARALLRKPAALILDEATSNLDVESQAKFMETLKSLKGSLTVVIITHRLELLELADQHIDLESSAAISA